MDDGGVTEVLSTHTVGSCPGLGQAAQTVEMFHPQLVAGQDCQHHRLMVSGTICCVVEFVYTDTMVTGFAGLSVCTEECGTNLKISQMT